jgi:nicotinamide-nucleotide amidase
MPQGPPEGSSSRKPSRRSKGSVRVEVVAVGTELLLGQVVDTNSSWIAERLAANGFDCHYQTRVGDNSGRIAGVVRAGLARNEAVIVCGGLGPTQDDVTREALAEVMGVELVRDQEIAEALRRRFSSHGRTMPENNLRQADVPRGATVIAQSIGTAPGLICPVGWKTIYAVPGVPSEMREMVERAVLADLRRRYGESGVVASRTLRTWGATESRLAEMLADHMVELDRDEEGVPTLAFLASGIEGIKVRITVKAPDHVAAESILAKEESELRGILGDLVFGVDEESMEHAVARMLVSRGLSLATAESLTGGLVAARLIGVEGASRWFRGSVVAYDPAVKFSLLSVPEGPVVTPDAARAMASGARSALGADVGLALTGVAGPDPLEGVEPGTVVIGLDLGGGEAEAVTVRLPGDRKGVRELAAISALDLLRRRLGASG